MKKVNAPQSANTHNHSTAIQRRKLLQALKDADSSGLTTIECREGLDIMMPAARVHELRHRDGYNIQSIRGQAHNAQGNRHSCARYVLVPGKWQGSSK